MWDFHLRQFKKAKEAEVIPDILSNEELHQLFAALKNPKHRLLIKAGYGFGLRVNSALHLRLKDFDLDRNLLHIKGDKGKKDRVVMLSQNFLNDLERKDMGGVIQS